MVFLTSYKSANVWCYQKLTQISAVRGIHGLPIQAVMYYVVSLGEGNSTILQAEIGPGDGGSIGRVPACNWKSLFDS